VTLDAGPLIAADRGDRAFWTWWKLVTRRGLVAAVPTTVVAQVWRGPRQARMAQVLSGCQPVPLDLALARAAGELCARSRTADIVDASVIAVAAARGDDVLTSDPADIKRLAALVKGIGRVRDLRAAQG
jgi:predicted nucleic acid-binding protein